MPRRDPTPLFHIGTSAHIHADINRWCPITWFALRPPKNTISAQLLNPASEQQSTPSPVSSLERPISDAIFQ